jgi:hypothetical protein
LEKGTVLIWNSWTIYRILNRLLFANVVVDQAAQKTEYYLAYYMGVGGINKPAAAAKSLAYISLLQHLDAFCN